MTLRAAATIPINMSWTSRPVRMPLPWGLMTSRINFLRNSIDKFLQSTRSPYGRTASSAQLLQTPRSARTNCRRWRRRWKLYENTSRIWRTRTRNSPRITPHALLRCVHAYSSVQVQVHQVFTRLYDDYRKAHLRVGRTSGCAATRGETRRDEREYARHWDGGGPSVLLILTINLRQYWYRTPRQKIHPRRAINWKASESEINTFRNSKLVKNVAQLNSTKSSRICASSSNSNSTSSMT